METKTDLLEPNNTAPANDDVIEGAALPARSTETLVNGIIADAQRLIEQQLAMFRQEIRDDFGKNKQAALFLTVSVFMAMAGTLLLLLLLPLLLNWAMPELPLWGCFGIVGGVLVALSGVLLYVGVRKFKPFDLLSNQAVEAFKENLQWKTKPT